MSNNGVLSSSKSARAATGNRQSVHNGVASRDGSHSAAQMPAFNASVVPPNSQGQPYKQQQGDVSRSTPQPLQGNDEMSDEDIAQLVKDHKELRKPRLLNRLLSHALMFAQVRNIPK